MNPASVVPFATEAEAQQAGYRKQYLGQLRKTDGRLRGMNTAQAGDLVENLG
jgi:hypothetical protein